MARMFPRELPLRIRKEPRRLAEIKVYDRLRTQLSEDWTVYYSVAWLGLVREGDGLRDGEVDFIAAHPRHGVVLLEVKGGGVRFDPETMTWSSTDRNQEEHEIDPFEQVMRSDKALVRKIRFHPKWGEGWVSFARGVVFPDCQFNKTVNLPANASREMILDCDDLGNLEQRLIDLTSYWTVKDAKWGRLDMPRLIRFLEDIVAPKVEVQSLLSAKIRDQEEVIFRLTTEQYKLLAFLSGRRRAAINGCAGSGKTMLAIEKARKLAGEGFRTLLTCFNRQLADHLAAALGNQDNLTVATFDRLCLDCATAAGIEPGGLDDNPSLLLRAMDAMPELKFDAIIVDEGQDFCDDDWIATEYALKDGKESILYVFYDDNQKLQKKGTIPNGLETFPLSENLRNTRAIYDLLRRYYESSVTVAPRGPAGTAVEFARASSSNDIPRLLNKILQRLVRGEGVGTHNIVVLTSRKLDETGLDGTTLDCGLRLIGAARRSNDIRLSTIQSFKGLEAPVVIIVLVADWPASDELYYVAFSRACHHLVILGDDESISRVDGQGLRS